VPPPAGAVFDRVSRGIFGDSTRGRDQPPAGPVPHISIRGIPGGSSTLPEANGLSGIRSLPGSNALEGTVSGSERRCTSGISVG